MLYSSFQLPLQQPTKGHHTRCVPTLEEFGLNVSARGLGASAGGLCASAGGLGASARGRECMWSGASECM